MGRIANGRVIQATGGVGMRDLHGDDSLDAIPLRMRRKWLKTDREIMRTTDSTVYDLIGNSNAKLNVSVTTGPSSPPTFNVYVTSQDRGGIDACLKLDMSQAHDLLEKLTKPFEIIDDDTAAAANSTLQ